MKHFFRPMSGAFLALSMALPAFAAEPVQQHNSNALWFENWIDLSNATLKVIAPDGNITDVYTATGTPVFQLNGADVLDGVYRYELSAASAEREKIVNKVNNGRGDAAQDDVAKPVYLNGAFTVSRGVIITPEDVSEDNN